MADISIPKQGTVLNKDVDGNVLVNDRIFFFLHVLRSMTQVLFLMILNKN